MFKKDLKRKKRKASIRKQVMGTAEKPRFSIFRSNQHIYAQLIDDKAGKTLAAASDVKITEGTKQERAAQVGTQLAKLAKKQKLENAIFDRNGYKFHGRVQALANAASAAGLNF